MTATGWLNEAPDEQAPAMPLSSLLLSFQENRASPLEEALARSQAQERREAREAAVTALDPDAHAATMISRGYTPGALVDLGQRLADTEAQLAAEQEKIERGVRVAARAQREHAAGRVNVWEMQALLDGDFGDAHRAAQLERRAASLRRQLGDAQAMTARPQERVTDGVEAASRHAHQLFREVTRQRMADAQAGRPPAPRPFGSASRGGAAVRSEQCVHCIAQGVDPETSYLLHSDPEFNVPVTPPERADTDAYAPGAVITTHYEQLRSADGGPVAYR